MISHLQFVFKLYTMTNPFNFSTASDAVKQDNNWPFFI